MGTGHVMANEHFMKSQFFGQYLKGFSCRDPLRKIRDYIIGMISEPVRKIVGWILLIFGAVALLRLYPGGLFFGLTDLMFMITFFGGIFSFRRHF